jgi:hypothetical protein
MSVGKDVSSWMAGMPRDITSELNYLSAAFTRLADIAGWVRAGFCMSTKGFGFFMLGRPPEQGKDDCVVVSTPLEHTPVICELNTLTTMAGNLLRTLLKDGRYQWHTLGTPPERVDRRKLWELWLAFLAFTPPLFIHCRTAGADEGPSLLPPELGQKHRAFWIDGYAQVCVAALAHMRMVLLSEPVQERITKQSGPLRNEKRDAWVARQRDKKPPLSWKEIYRLGFQLATKRRWSMPSSAKALQEAYRKHLARQRKTGKN